MDLPSANTVTLALTALGGLIAYLRNAKNTDKKDLAKQVLGPVVDHAIDELVAFVVSGEKTAAEVLATAPTWLAHEASSAAERAGIPEAVALPLMRAAIEVALRRIRADLNRWAEKRIPAQLNGLGVLGQRMLDAFNAKPIVPPSEMEQRSDAPA